MRMQCCYPLYFQNRNQAQSFLIGGTLTPSGNVALSALLGDLPAIESSYSPIMGSPAFVLQILVQISGCYSRAMQCAVSVVL